MLNRTHVPNSERTLLVIAHPDDEVMFFTPLMLEFCYRKKAELSILCLSTGNFEGLGSTRSNELLKCCSIFDVSAQNVHIIDDPELQDSMSNEWPTRKIAAIVAEYIKITGALQVVTFDEVGVSGHPNHIATYYGVKEAMQSEKNENVQFFKLKSKDVVRKFLGLLDILISFLLGEAILVHLVGPLFALRGIYIHRSQNLPYRQVFVLISSFSYINSFLPITSNSFFL